MKRSTNPTNQTQRRLSPIRVLIALMLIIILVSFSLRYTQRYSVSQTQQDSNPWYGSYVDATATPFYPFEQLGTTATPTIILSFIVSSPSDPCTPTWGGYYTLDEANLKLDLDRRIARLRQQGGDIAISFGGLLNDELSYKCTDPQKLYEAYLSVINRYSTNTIDLDIEGDELSDIESNKFRASTLAKLQQDIRSSNKSLAIWLTLPVTPQGLTVDGTNAISQMLAHGVDLAGVNVMTMNYGASKPTEQSMNEASQNALIQTHRQLGILYKQSGVNLNSKTLWSKIGATPMIGQNDLIDEIFSTEDATYFNQFAISKGIGRMSMWSANRDLQCGENYVDLKKVSDSCSGIKQAKFQFAQILSNQFTGQLSANASITTTNDPTLINDDLDDPLNSPYPIWNESNRYLAGTKIVWRKNVYQAKWWTQGDLPDNPILQSWETPWQLIGPVLPGEKPIPQPTLPMGTFPDWSGTTEYTGGEKVLFQGLPYQAKWWTKGDSPEKTSSDPDSSPWRPFTQTQINDLLNEIKSNK